MQKKPDEILREKINSRTRRALINAGKKIGKLKENEKKTPSQKRSESMRKKFARRD